MEHSTGARLEKWFWRVVVGTTMSLVFYGLLSLPLTEDQNGYKRHAAVGLPGYGSSAPTHTFPRCIRQSWGEWDSGTGPRCGGAR